MTVSLKEFALDKWQITYILYLIRPLVHVVLSLPPNIHGVQRQTNYLPNASTVQLTFSQSYLRSIH